MGKDMKEEEIRRLVKIVEESNMSELEISRWGKTIKISKFSRNSHLAENSAAEHTYPAPVFKSAQPHVDVNKAEQPAIKKPATTSKKTTEIKAPMVGTFYRAPSPDAKPYVDVNESIKKGQVLCIIEAMKLMNEIESEYDGLMVEVLVENGQPVEYNQPLFRIETK